MEDTGVEVAALLLGLWPDELVVVSARETLLVKPEERPTWLDDTSLELVVERNVVDKASLDQVEDANVLVSVENEEMSSVEEISLVTSTEELLLNAGMTEECILDEAPPDVHPAS